MADLAVIILTLNESRHVERAIKSVKGIAREIFVVDSHSTDNTVAIARTCGAHVLQRSFINYAKQFQWALDYAPIRAAWVMRLDADEIIEADLATEIERRLPAMPEGINGINFRRKHIFMGRWIRHGGRYPLTLLRLWKRGFATIEDRWMDEHMVLKSGHSIVFEGGFADHNLNNLTFFTDKHNRYATREAIDVILMNFGLVKLPTLTSNNTAVQARITRWLKENLYNQRSIYSGPLLYFFLRYFLQLGFLDGKEGLIYHFLQGFWYRLLVCAKVEEIRRELKWIPNRDAQLRRLSDLTGYQMEEFRRDDATMEHQ